jgi:hypothetical protein
MEHSWRNPALIIGFVLLVLGIGNWLVSANKIAEYAPHRDTNSTDEEVTSLDDFPQLNRWTNTTLLKRLNRGDANYTLAGAKSDFYHVVESGGRILTFIGLLLMTGALVHNWRRRSTRSP